MALQIRSRFAHVVRAARWLDGAIALAVFGASLAILAAFASETEGAAGIDPVTATLTAASTLPLVARRAAPVAVFLLTALASTALSGVTEAASPPIGPTLALYWMVAQDDDSRPRARIMLALVVPLLLIHAAASGLEQGRFPAPELLWGVAVWGGAWIAAEQTRIRRQRFADLEERAVRAEREAERERRLAAAEERTRIARDLHDSAGHAINVILVHAGLGRMRAETGGEGDAASAREELETIEQVARETAGEIGQLVEALRDDSPENGAEVEAPPGLAAIDALAERHRAAGMEVEVRVRGERPPLPPAVDRGAYRILQEALTNASRHGTGTAEVEISFDDAAVEVAVTNPLPPGHVARASGGHGVIGMRERAAILGGSLDAGARDGRFEARARLPTAERSG